MTHNKSKSVSFRRLATKPSSGHATRTDGGEVTICTDVRLSTDETVRRIIYTENKLRNNTINELVEKMGGNELPVVVRNSPNTSGVVNVLKYTENPIELLRKSGQT